MRRFPKGILFCTLAAATAMELCAQARVGLGRSTSSAVFVRNSGIGGRAFSVPQNYPAPLGLQPHAAGYTGINQRALRTRGGYRNIWPGYFLTPYYYPALDYGSAPYAGAAFDAPPAEDPNFGPAMDAQNQLGAQVQRLSEAVDQLRSGQQQSQADAVSAQANQPQQAPVTLVLRSGQQLQVRNFAVMDKMIWDFTKPGVHKIPISSVDVAASAKATEANGGEFPSLD